MSQEQNNEQPVHSFNVKFVLEGLECQLSVRGEDHGSLIKSIPDILARIGVIGGGRRPVVNGSPRPQAPVKAKEKAILCPQCQVPGHPIQGSSAKQGGREFYAQKCPQCGEFLPGTFRWVGNGGG